MTSFQFCLEVSGVFCDWWRAGTWSRFLIASYIRKLTIYIARIAIVSVKLARIWHIQSLT